MFVPCYLPRILRKIYKKILIPYYDWRAGRKIIKEEKQRIKLGYSEEEWVEIKSKNLKYEVSFVWFNEFFLNSYNGAKCS